MADEATAAAGEEKADDAKVELTAADDEAASVAAVREEPASAAAAAAPAAGEAAIAASPIASAVAASPEASRDATVSNLSLSPTSVVLLTPGQGEQKIAASSPAAKTAADASPAEPSQLLLLARRFQAPVLEGACIDHLLASMRQDNLAELLLFAHEQNLPWLLVSLDWLEITPNSSVMFRQLQHGCLTMLVQSSDWVSGLLESEGGARLPRPLLLRVMKCARIKEERPASAALFDDSARNRRNRPETVAAAAPNDDGGDDERRAAPSESVRSLLRLLQESEMNLRAQFDWDS